MMRIKEVIKENGLTVKEVANKLGMTSPSLSDAINGNPTVEKVERIAEAIGVPISELFESQPSDTINCPNCGAQLSLRKKE
jgi:transcriptional regulator with XRE-family HTH domain